MKKRVFHLISELDVGGTEKQLALLLPELQKHFINEVICLTGHGAVGRALEAEHIPVHYLNATGWHDPRLALRLFRVLRQRRPHSLVTYLILSDIAGRIIGRLAGIKTIICSQRSRLFGPPWRHQLDRFTRYLVTHYTCQTEPTKELLQRTLKLSSQNITVIPNAIPELFFSAAHHKRSISQNSLTILCVANLKPEKRLDLLLPVFDELAQKYPSIHLQIIGEGPQRHQLERQIARLVSRNRIHLLGLRSDIPQLLAASDIFVLPTSIEGMSNALLEAMAAALPCVTTNLPVNTVIITEGKNGLLFDLNQPHTLATQLERLIRDPTLRLSLGQSAKSRAHDNYSLAHIAQMWIHLINKLA